MGISDRKKNPKKLESERMETRRRMVDMRKSVED